jgi:hypothetical protein
MIPTTMSAVRNSPEHRNAAAHVGTKSKIAIPIKKARDTDQNDIT